MTQPKPKSTLLNFRGRSDHSWESITKKESCTLGRSVLGIGSGAARFLMIAEYATYRYLRCVVNVKKE